MAARLKKALVVGYGSIGRRHARILVELGCEVAVVSGRAVDFAPRYAELGQALAEWQPQYVVVAARTGEHRAVVDALVERGFRGSVLIEKPLFEAPSALPRHEFAFAAVAYNLRCHPLLARLKALLDGAHLATASIYVGSYLPDWRPDADYRESYSAKRGLGGGVLRDLSHELDYALWLFGPWRRLTAAGGHLSTLEIDSDDAYTLLFETARCPLVSIHMNYLDRVPRREITVNTSEQTIRVDLIGNTIAIGNVEESVVLARDDTYRAEHHAMLSGTGAALCGLEQAMDVLAMIEAAERAAASRTWVAR